MNFRYFQILFFLFCINLFSQEYDPLASQNYKVQKKWVDSVYKSLTMKEKIGQLFFVQSNSRKENNSAKIIKLINDYKIGGVIFSTGNIKNQIKLTNLYQEISKTPLIISMDAEWGIGMRLDSIADFPWNMSLGAIENDSIIFAVGKEIGFQCKRLGVHLNFAPVVDINTNPNNPIIGNRSFGENEYLISKQANSFINGMQSVGVLGSAKHFPGHGDTTKDSHKTLPVIEFSKERIFNTELFPFQEAIKNNIASIMVAHLEIPSIEKTNNLPSTLSDIIIDSILKKRLKFKGLIITDALDMKGVAGYSKMNVDLKAFLAGNDILLMSLNVKDGIESIKNAYEKGIVSEERLEHSVKKILMAKFKVGLHNKVIINDKNVFNDLNNPNQKKLMQLLPENINTLIKNKNNTIPVDLDYGNIINIRFGNAKNNTLIEFLNKYKKVKNVNASDFNSTQEMINELKKFDLVIASVHFKSNTPWDNMKKKLVKKESILFDNLNKIDNKILISFTNPYFLEKYDINHFDAILVAYQNNKFFQQVAAEQIFGAKKIVGKLPVSIGEKFQVGEGLLLKKTNILGFSTPESVGLNSDNLKKIDSIAEYAIKNKMAPGIQILVAKNSKVIYEKSFGTFKYDSIKNVNNSSFFDLASLTKMLVTTPIIMGLVDENIITLDSKIGDLIPRYKNSNKSNITVKDLLSANASIKPWIPFYSQTLDSIGKPKKSLYSPIYDSIHSVKVSPNLFLNMHYKDTIRNIVKNSDLMKNKISYSDLSYIILQEYIENYFKNDLDYIIKNQIFNRIGVDLTYNPYRSMSIENILPTEIDNYFRGVEIQGYVHDMLAAMFGGIAGHAGLFGNAINVAKMMQMFLQNGNYAGNQILSENSLRLFNKCYYCSDGNRRGVGFDKPQLKLKGPTCNCLSMMSFGHTGWTGTIAWADPDTEIVYVFLSNRSYPDGEMAINSRLVKENIRSEIQKVIYESIID